SASSASSSGSASTSGSLGAAAFFAAVLRGADERVDDFLAVVFFAVVLEVESAVSVSTASASVPFAAFVAAARVELFAVGEVSAVLEEVTEFLVPAAARVGAARHTRAIGLLGAARGLRCAGRIRSLPVSRRTNARCRQACRV